MYCQIHGKKLKQKANFHLKWLHFQVCYFFTHLFCVNW
jgi:hypothetical protein